MRGPLTLVLAFLACGCLVVAVVTDARWAAIGFLVFGGLPFVLYPRKTGDEAARYAPASSLPMPRSQPARTIVAVLIGLFCLALAAALIFG